MMVVDEQHAREQHKLAQERRQAAHAKELEAEELCRAARLLLRFAAKNQGTAQKDCPAAIVAELLRGAQQRPSPTGDDIPFDPEGESQEVDYGVP